MTLDPFEAIRWGAAVLELRSRIIQIGAEEVPEGVKTNGRHCSVANDLDKKETTEIRKGDCLSFA